MDFPVDVDVGLLNLNVHPNEDVLTFDANDESSYQDLQNLMKGYIEADCWGLEVNQEVVFDHYRDSSRSLQQNILTQMIREQIIQNLHGSLLVYLHRAAVDSVIKIHMFQDKSLTVLISYNALTRVFMVELLSSNS
jgi:hypothetical protein